MRTYSLCLLVPVFDHEQAIARVCEQLKPLGLPILLVDDGSHRACAEVLNQLANQQHHLIRLVQNSGKGVALRVGMAEAQRLGYTHVLTLDADGQHDIDDLPAFIEHSQRAQDCLIIGTPRYAYKVPWFRRYRRYLTSFTVRLSCLSRAVRDSTCGVRVYPLAAVNRLLSRCRCGDRMEFDTEVLVRWLWRGGRCENVPMRVHAPHDGISHYRIVRDNLRMGWTCIRLLGGMMIRLPWLLKQRKQLKRARKAAATSSR